MRNQEPDIPDYYTVPSPFLRRYKHLLKHPEELSSTEELVQFWIFAIEQGRDEHVARDFIARLVVEITLKSPAMKDIRNAAKQSSLTKAYDLWCTLEYTSETKEVSDRLWIKLSAFVDKV